MAANVVHKQLHREQQRPCIPAWLVCHTLAALEACRPAAHRNLSQIVLWQTSIDKKNRNTKCNVCKGKVISAAASSEHLKEQQRPSIIPAWFDPRLM
jgi:hypothetical protein